MAVCYAVGFYFLGVPAWAGIAMIAGLLNAVPAVCRDYQRHHSRLRFQFCRRQQFRSYRRDSGRVRRRPKSRRLLSNAAHYGRPFESAPDGGLFRLAGRRQIIRFARHNYGNSGNRHRQSLFQIPARTLLGILFLPRGRSAPGGRAERKNRRPHRRSRRNSPRRTAAGRRG